MPSATIQLTNWSWVAALVAAMLPTSALSEQQKPHDDALIKANREFLGFTQDKMGGATLDLFTPEFETFVRRAAREAAFGRPKPRSDQLLTHWAYSVRLLYTCEVVKDDAAAQRLAKRAAERPPRALLAQMGAKPFYAYAYNKPYWELKWSRVPSGQNRDLASLATLGQDYDSNKTVVRGTVRIRRITGQWRIVFADYHDIMRADWPSYRRYLARLASARETAPKHLLSGFYDEFLVAHNVVANFVALSGFDNDPSKASCAYYRRRAPDAAMSLRTRVRYLQSRAIDRALEPISQWHTRQ